MNKRGGDMDIGCSLVHDNSTHGITTFKV
jgi:hypothetical protein